MNLLLDTHILLWVLAKPKHNNQYHLVTVDDKIVQYQMPYVIGV